VLLEFSQGFREFEGEPWKARSGMKKAERRRVLMQDGAQDHYLALVTQDRAWGLAESGQDVFGEAFERDDAEPGVTRDLMCSENLPFELESSLLWGDENQRGPSGI